MQHGPRGGPMGPRPRMDFSRGRPPPMEDPAREKAIRSIFVANISFETTEEQLRAVLSEVGPVVSLKLIYDPGTGRPRGFGFCEYEDGETAMSAVRNLAGKEVNGRPLRIDSATNAPGGEFKGGGGGSAGGSRALIEPPLHGPPVPPEAAPEAITKAVASLPPEQMFELMKQMKWCIEKNPEETRQLLLHNPQLAYGLLQAQVVMRIVDLETAQNLLHRTPRGPPLNQGTEPHPPPPSHPPQHHQHHPSPPGRQGSPVEAGFGPPRERFGGPPPPRRDENFGGPPPPRRDENFGGPPPQRRDESFGGPPPQRRDENFGGPLPPRRDERFSGPPHRGPPPGHQPPGGRFGGAPPGPHPSRGPPDSGPRAPPHSSPSPGPAPGNMGGLTPQDQEKAALIMQVLSLSDEQILMLPPDQRNSILKLKEQIARSN